MFTPIERLPAQEVELRHERLRARLAQTCPQAAGLLVFSRVNLYYLTGCMANGLLWLPREGAAALLLRRGMERARLESPLERVLTFRSYGDLPGVLEDAGCPLPSGEPVAAEMSGLSWSLANLLQKKLPGLGYVSGDQALTLARSVKTPYEMNKMTLAGERHHKALFEILPQHIRPGMNERQISHLAWEAFFSLGHAGIMRMNAFGEEIFLGHVSAGDSGNYPSMFNGPVGLRGEHPAAPFMGYAGKVWQTGEPLACDIGFSLEGYQTDKTQIYWAGPESSLPDEVKRAHQFCLDIQEYLGENLRPGVIPSALYKDCMERADKAGVNGAAGGFMALGGNKVTFLGHGIGLAIDEYPVIAKGFDQPLEEGNVLALEPKMGIPDLGMVGTENTWKVTPDGGVCLTGQDYSIICVD